MMKKSLVSILLVLQVMPLFAQGNTFDNLSIDSMWIDGNRVANTDQELHVVFNKRNNAYSFAWGWVLLATEAGSSSTMTLGWAYTDLTYDKKTEEVLKFKAPKAGTYHFHIAAMWGSDYVFMGHNGLTATFIEQYEKPNLHTVYTVHMSKPSDEPGSPNTVYGSRICGTVEITNEGTQPYYCKNGLRIALSDPDGQEATYAQSPLDYGVEAGTTITRDFCYDIPYSPDRYVDNKEHLLSLVYTDDDGTHALDEKFRFVVRRPTNTYHTADGQKHDLPIGPNNLLQIPAEALAVDLRGQNDLNTTFTVDASKANPNCLFYLDATDHVPLGLENRMVVYNYLLENLTVNGDYDYYCPLPFYAVNAFFTYAPVSEQWGKPENVKSPTMSGTVTMPFDVQDAWLVSVNDAPVFDVDFSDWTLSICRFTSDNANQLTFKPVGKQTLNAYEPYLINSVLPSPITFYAEFITVPATKKVVVHGHQFDFVGTTIGQQASPIVYRWSCDNKYFYKSESNESIRPFTAYMVANSMSPEDSQQLYVNVISKETTDIDNATGCNVTATPQMVYTLSGQCLGHADVKHLKPGLYIIGGQKTVVR